MEDGKATSSAESVICMGENCLDKKNSDKYDVDNNPGGISTTVSTGGGAIYTFGNSDIERYCHFKLQLNDTDPTNDAHAKYYIDILTWDNGFSESRNFEDQYNMVCS